MESLMSLRPLVRRSLCGAVLLTLPSLAFSQGNSSCVNDRYYDSTTYAVTVESLCDGLLLAHPGLPAGASSRPAFADFTGDRRLDAFMVVGGQPVLSVSPGAIDMTYPMTLPSHSFWMTAVGALEFDDGLLPMMVASTDTGIQTWKLDGTTGIPSPTFVNASSWAFATELLSADVDGDGAEELIGLFSHEPVTTEIRVGRLSRTGQMTDIAALTLQIPMPSVSTVDWDATRPGDEISLVFQQRAYLLNDQLALVEAHFLSELSVDAAAIQDHTGPGVAVITRSGSTDSLVVLRPGSMETPIPLGNTGVTSVVAANYAAYDLGDLILSGAGALSALANKSRIASVTFDGSLDVVYDRLPTAEEGPYTMEPWIAAGDFDNDLDADLFLHDSAGQNVVVVLGTVRSEGHLAPKIEEDHYPAVTAHSGPTSMETITIDLQHVGWRQLTNTTHFELEAWDPAGGVDVSYERVPLSSLSNNVVPVSFTIDVSNVQFSSRSMVLVRPVTVHPITGAVTETGPDLRLKVPLGLSIFSAIGPVPSSTDPDPPSRGAGGGGPPTPGGG